jgi:hypothetical protein
MRVRGECRHVRMRVRGECRHVRVMRVQESKAEAWQPRVLTPCLRACLSRGDTVHTPHTMRH